MESGPPFGEFAMPQPLDEGLLGRQEDYDDLPPLETVAPLEPLPQLEEKAPSIGSCPDSGPQIANPAVGPVGEHEGLPCLQQSVSEVVHGSDTANSPPPAQKTRRRRVRCTHPAESIGSGSDSQSLGDEDRKKKRLERNRKSARESRRRKKDYIKNLEAEVQPSLRYSE